MEWLASIHSPAAKQHIVQSNIKKHDVLFKSLLDIAEDPNAADAKKEEAVRRRPLRARSARRLFAVSLPVAVARVPPVAETELYNKAESDQIAALAVPRKYSTSKGVTDSDKEKLGVVVKDFSDLLDKKLVSNINAESSSQQTDKAELVAKLDRLDKIELNKIAEAISTENLHDVINWRKMINSPAANRLFVRLYVVLFTPLIKYLLAKAVHDPSATVENENDALQLLSEGIAEKDVN